MRYPIEYFTAITQLLLLLLLILQTTTTVINEGVGLLLLLLLLYDSFVSVLYICAPCDILGK